VGLASEPVSNELMSSRVSYDAPTGSVNDADGLAPSALSGTHYMGLAPLCIDANTQPLTRTHSGRERSSSPTPREVISTVEVDAAAESTRSSLRNAVMMPTGAHNQWEDCS